MPDTVAVAAEDIRTVSAVLSVAATAFGSYLGNIPGFGAAIEACGRLAAAAERGGMPEDPVSGPRQLAVTHHELMLAYSEAGFDRSEAVAFTLAYAHAAATVAAMRGGTG